MKTPNAADHHRPDDTAYFGQLLDQAGMPVEQVAARVGLTDRALRYYKAGQRPIPYSVQYALEALAANARRRQNRAGP